MRRGFGSDNHSGVSPEVMEAIASVNNGHALAYGDDEYCKATEGRFRELFGDHVRVFFAFNGTGCNTLCLDAMTHSYEAVVCASTAHINVDECGAPQRVIGCRLITVDTDDGKLMPELVLPHLHGFGFEHHSQPKVISITQPTELGTLYTIDEIRTLVDFAHSYKMYLHIDGARLANAAVALDTTFRAMTTDLGVDAVSFGGTKNGLMMGEAVLLINPDIAPDFKYRRKQAMQLCSKMRFIAAQFDAYLADGLWKRNAAHSNMMAQMLAEKVKQIDGVEIVYPVQANGVFARLPREVWKQLQQYYFFYDWDENNDVVRWMCSFDTTEEDIENFVTKLKDLMVSEKIKNN